MALAGLLTLGVLPLWSLAQQSANMPRLGLLAVRSAGASVNIDQIRSELRTRGYTENRNLIVDDRFLVASYGELPRAAQLLLAERPTVVLALGDTATEVISKATSTVPIVGSSSTDPVKKGLAESIARPGKNLTGVLTVSGDVTAKRLEIIKEAVPGLKRAVLVMNSGSAGEVAISREIQGAARQLGVELTPVDIRSAGDFEAASAAIAKARADGVVVVSSTMFIVNREALVAAIAKARVPAIFAVDSIADAGGLMSYGQNAKELAQIRARLVDQVLKGRRPADIPFEQVTKLELVINLKTARALNLSIPQSLLVRADRVIE